MNERTLELLEPVIGRASAASFTKQDRTVLWPHLQQAAQSHWALQPLRQAECSIEATLHVLPTPTWIIREDFHIEFANTAAGKLMRASIWVRKRAGRLQAIGNLDTESLRNRLRSGMRMFAVSNVFNREIQRGMLRVIPIAETALYAGLWPHANALLMLEVAALREHSALWLAHLAERFHLTHTQCVILERLSRGLCVDEIATSQGIKIGTVRAHLHELLSKTGQTNQAGLVRLALGM